MSTSTITPSSMFYTPTGLDGPHRLAAYQTPQRSSTKFPETPRSITPSPMFRRSSFMDAIVDSRPAIDHDNFPARYSSPSRARSARIAAQKPVPQKQAELSPSTASSSSLFLDVGQSVSRASHSKTAASLQEDAKAAAQVAETPRRGRRLGQVDMGWESPMNTGRSAPHSRALIAISDPNRQSIVAEEAAPSASRTSTYASLVDRHTWASIAVVAAERATAFDQSSRSSTPTPMGLPTDRPAAQIDYLAPFRIDTPPRDTRLVPVIVNTMGRIAVHASLASQITSLSYLPSDHQSLLTPHYNADSHPHHPSSSDGSSGGSSSSTSASALTNPTSVNTPGLSHPSPSFSLCSQFPASEADSSPLAEKNRAPNVLTTALSAQRASGSPVALKRKGDHLRDLLEKVAPSLLRNSRERWRHESDETRSKRLKPSLPGEEADVPCLDWPDREDGPWADASKAILRKREDRLADVRSWLAEETDESPEDGTADGEAFAQQHPMVAKVLLDRVRKHAQAQREASWAELATPSSVRTPRRRSAKGKSATSTGGSSARTRSAKSRKSSAGSKRVAARSKRKGGPDFEHSANCLCGLGDDVAPMVQCDSCNSWYHLPCVGIRDVDDLDNEWFCTACFADPFKQRDHSVSTPVYSINTASLTSTGPSNASHRFPRDDQMLPVFVPAGSPMHSRVSSALALAPSPPIHTLSRFGARDPDLARGRARASRVGWHLTEPESPLDRKGSPGGKLRTPGLPSTYIRPVTVTTAAGAKLTSTSLYDGPARGTPGARQRAHWDNTPTRGGMASSPSVGHSSLRASVSAKAKAKSKVKTPKSSAALAAVRGESSSDEGDVADNILSTPSRLPKSSSWAYLSNTASSQTPTRSRTPQPNVRDALASSWGLPSALRTPSRDLLGSAFNADTSAAYSGGLPSLVFSSGGLDVDDFHHSRAWQLQSPTSSTRAALAKTSVAVSTPDLLPTWHHSATSSVRGSSKLAPSSASRSTSTNQRHISRGLRAQRTPEAEGPQGPQTVGSSPYSTQAPPTSSSPFPATPTYETRELSTGLPIGSEDPYEEEKRRRGTIPSSGRALAKIAGEDGVFGTGAPVMAKVPSQQGVLGMGVSAAVGQKKDARGMGFEMELDDVVQWSQ